MEDLPINNLNGQSYVNEQYNLNQSINRGCFKNVIHFLTQGFLLYRKTNAQISNGQHTIQTIGKNSTTTF